MGNSTRTLQSVIDYVRTFPDVMPTFEIAGFTQAPALTIGNKVMTDMLAEVFPWKWNRMVVPVFYTVGWQQDYASPMAFSQKSPAAQQVGISTLSWLENGVIVDINNNALPKPIFDLEVVRDLPRTFYQWGAPTQVSWLPNDQLYYGTWGQTAIPGGVQNPGPLSVYTNPAGVVVTPTNPIAQVIDPNGNFQVMVGIVDNSPTGTAGATQPSWPAAGATVGTQTVDGRAHGAGAPSGLLWQVVDPKQTGFRLSPVPPQAGNVWQINLFAQMKPPTGGFTAKTQLLDPIPDEYASYFEDGFVAYCYKHSSSPAIQAKFKTAWELWKADMATATRKADRERDEAGFYPDRPIMSNTWVQDPGPAWPYRR